MLLLVGLFACNIKCLFTFWYQNKNYSSFVTNIILGYMLYITGRWRLQRYSDSLPRKSMMASALSPGLRELTLSANPAITGKGWARLAIAVAHSSQLRVLNLDYNPLGKNQITENKVLGHPTVIRYCLNFEKSTFIISYGELWWCINESWG